jgi:peptidoglycan/LPS O-acetylase OafA/YrhL
MRRIEMRRFAVVAGVALVVVAFTAATRVADTREGLIAEVVTLLAGGAGVGFLIYGLAARPRTPTSQPVARAPRPIPPRTTRDLLVGAGGVALSAILVIGLAISGGPLSAVFGLVVLLPMIAGCVYLCVRFLRANP